MLDMLGSRRRFCDGLTRRQTLQAGAISAVAGLTLPNLLRAEAESAALTRQLKDEKSRLIALIAELNLAKQAAAEPSRSSAECLAIISPQLRTLLHPLPGFLAVIKEQFFVPVGLGNSVD